MTPASIHVINGTPTLPAFFEPLPCSFSFLDREALTTALPVARELLAHVGTDADADNAQARIVNRFLSKCGQTGNGRFAEVIAYVFSDEFEDNNRTDSGAYSRCSTGEILVSFTEPGIALGIALAWLLLTDRGGAR